MKYIFRANSEQVPNEKTSTWLTVQNIFDQASETLTRGALNLAADSALLVDARKTSELYAGTESHAIEKVEIFLQWWYKVMNMA